MIHDMMPGTEDQLLEEMTSGYIGFDPTADSLHIGNLVPIMLLVHLQRADTNLLCWLGVQQEELVILPEKPKNENYFVEQINHNLESQKNQL